MDLGSSYLVVRSSKVVNRVIHKYGDVEAEVDI